MCNDIVSKLKSGDENFIMGVSLFVSRYEKLKEGSTRSVIPQIASAIHTFASRHLNRFQTTTKKKRIGKRIKVQSTVAGRRRKGIS